VTALDVAAALKETAEHMDAVGVVRKFRVPQATLSPLCAGQTPT